MTYVFLIYRYHRTFFVLVLKIDRNIRQKYPARTVLSSWSDLRKSKNFVIRALFEAFFGDGVSETEEVELSSSSSSSEYW